MRTRTFLIATAAVTVILVLAGCSTPAGAPRPGSPPGGGSSTSEPVDANAVDTMFVMMMIPHHEQAIEMSDIVIEKDGVDQRVLNLARQIKDAQAPEIELMRGWLEGWGMPDMMSGGMNHGGGMMSEDDMESLNSANSPELERLFLEQMIAHHEGAIDMAQGVINNGQNADVIALAERIVAAQADEIAVMQELLTTI